MKENAQAADRSANNNNRVSPEDEKSFNFAGRTEKNNVIILETEDRSMNIPVGTVHVGEKEIFGRLDAMRGQIRDIRNEMSRGMTVTIERSHTTLEQFSWIVRLYRWLKRHGWTAVDYEQIGLIGGLVHANSLECNQKLVLKNERFKFTATIIKMFNKSGYLVKCRPISSLIDQTDESTKTRIVDSVIQIKNTLKEFVKDEQDDDEFLDI